ncbi:MAG: hypothetical protein KAT46_03335 [Deltaproteobacteria bacterium]|nr:hypothetical protein [Deltaproteobacteria bacterium]
MAIENKPGKKIRFFVARELQLTIAFMVVMALLGGIILQTVSTLLSSQYGVTDPGIGVFLVLGYVAIVGILSIIFSTRLVGPFKRLEYEMSLIKIGDLSKRLGLRTEDDLHLRNFIININELIDGFEKMSISYSELNSEVSLTLERVLSDEWKGSHNLPESLNSELEALQKKVHEFREKW